MAQQTVLDKTKTIDQEIGSLEYFLKIADFFLKAENRKLKYQNDYWTFKKIDALLRGWAVLFSLELENASFEEIVAFIKNLISSSNLLKEALIKAGIKPPLSFFAIRW